MTTKARLIFEVESDTDAEKLAHNLGDLIEATAEDDWGHDTWGGYPGPYLTGISFTVEPK